MALSWVWHWADCATELSVALSWLCHWADCATELTVTLNWLCHWADCDTELTLPLYWLWHWTDCATELLLSCSAINFFCICDYRKLPGSVYSGVKSFCQCRRMTCAPDMPKKLLKYHCSLAVALNTHRWHCSLVRGAKLSVCRCRSVLPRSWRLERPNGAMRSDAYTGWVSVRVVTGRRRLSCKLSRGGSWVGGRRKE